MKVAAAYALAGLVSDEELAEDYVLPPAFLPGIADVIAAAVANAWKE
jgi:malate dehydrogenase (oxaloacetate-decarboxylating)